MDFDVFVMEDFCHAPAALKKAIQEGHFEGAEQQLKGLALSPEDAGWLLHLRMEDMPLSLVQRIWSQCADRQTLLSQDGHLTVFTKPCLGDAAPDQLHWHHSVLETALCADRPDIAQFLLEKGASLTVREGWTTPLEAAIAGGACKSTQWLLDRGVSTAPTEGLMQIYCRAGYSLPKAAAQLAAQAIWGENFSLDDLKAPLPDDFTLEEILTAQNYFFVLRYLQYNKLNLTERKHLVNQLNWFGLVRGWQPEGVASYLGIMLTYCPDLLRFQKLQRLVAGAALLTEDGISPHLEPWVSQLPDQVELREEDGFIWAGPQGLLTRWNQRLPSGVRPVLSRKQPFPDEKPTSAMVSQLFHTCSLVEEPGKKLSPLVVSVLAAAEPEILAWTMDACGLLSGENLDMLKRYCLNESLLIRKENRQYLMERFGWKEDAND